MEHFYQNMKSQFVLLLFVTSIVANHVDLEPYHSDDVVIEIEDSVCGPHSFSNNVKAAFLKEINKNYLNSELYELKDWIIILGDNYCKEDLANLFDLSSTEDYLSLIHI